MYEIPGFKYEIGGFDDEPHERLLNYLRDLMDIRDLIKPALNTAPSSSLPEHWREEQQYCEEFKMADKQQGFML